MKATVLQHHAKLIKEARKRFRAAYTAKKRDREQRAREEPKYDEDFDRLLKEMDDQEDAIDPLEWGEIVRLVEHMPRDEREDPSVPEPFI
jgi:hypothetical protein